MPGLDLTVDLSSFAAAPDRAALAALGAAFDADPALRPERMDTGDPIRVKVESATPWLSSVADGELPRRAAFQRRSAPEYVGDAELTMDPRAGDHPRRLWFGSGPNAWLGRPGNAVAFGELVVRLADAYGAAYGFAGDLRMATQQRRDFLRAAAGGTGSASPPTAFTDRFALRDVHWINVYGPAFVERFGARLDGLGVRQDRMRNGGVVIRATELPDLYDEAIVSHRDYPWKQPFYEALGPGAFLDPIRGSDGSVPTWDDHRRLAGGIGGASAEPAPARKPEPAPAEPAAAPAPSWLVAIVRDLRNIGFFADPDRDDARMASDLAADHAAESGEPLDSDADLVELEVAHRDADRVWWEDTEADVAPGNDAYVELIEGLARISRGGLDPTAVTEAWEGDQAVVRVRIELPGGSVEITPRYLEDHLDIETVLARLNDVLPADGPRFVLYAPFDQTAFVTCVTAAERGGSRRAAGRSPPRRRPAEAGDRDR